MEFKTLTPEEYLKMFPKIKLSKWAEEEFKKSCKPVIVVRIKNTKKFRPMFRNSVGTYYLIKDREVYINILN